MAKEKYALLLCMENGHEVFEFNDINDAIGFTDGSQNVVEAIVYNPFCGIYSRGSREVWYCNYKEASQNAKEIISL